MWKLRSRDIHITKQGRTKILGFICYSPWYYPDPVVLTWWSFCLPEDIGQYLVTLLSQLGRRVLLPSGGWRPVLLLNTLQCPGQAPSTTKNYFTPDIDRNPLLIEWTPHLESLYFFFIVSHALEHFHFSQPRREERCFYSGQGRAGLVWEFRIESGDQLALGLPDGWREEDGLQDWPLGFPGMDTCPEFSDGPSSWPQRSLGEQ